MEQTTDEIQLPAQPALLITRGNTSQTYRPLDPGVTVLGRAERCDSRLETPSASDLQCIIARTQDGYRIRNYAERETVVLNGKPIRKALLKDGDLLEVASIHFRVYLPAEALVPPLAPALV